MRDVIAKILHEKESNLVFSADTTDPQELLHLASLLGPKIAILKTHIDIIDTNNYALFTEQLSALAKREKFLLFEDRKFADIGSTVQKQFLGGPYKIADWANLINAHPLPGPGMVKALHQATLAKKQACSLLLIAQMSAEGAFSSQDYLDYTLRIAQSHRDFVCGFIAQKRISPDFLHLTPGVSLDRKKDSLGQQFRTPEEALLRDDCDLLIVGRSIYEAPSPEKEAERFRVEGWRTFRKKNQTLSQAPL